MATETHATSSKVRWYPRWAPRLLVGIIVVCVLALVAVEVVAPLSAGLPVGWGQYNKSQFHLHIGTPPFWNVVGDSDLTQGAPNNCGFAMVTSPLSEPAQHSTLDTEKAPRWMAVFVAGPCFDVVPNPSQASVWQPIGQYIGVAGQVAPVEINSTPDIAQVDYRVYMMLHGYGYTLMLHEPSAAQAQQDMPTFLTFIQSFRATS